MQKTTVWSPLATSFFFLLTYIVLFISQTVGLFLYSGLDNPIVDMNDVEVEQILNNGSLTYWSVGLASVVCTLLLLAIIKLKSGTVIKEYLALHVISFKEALKWLGIGLLYLFFVQVFFSVIPHYFGIEVDVGNTTAEYNSADNLLLYYLTIVVLAPLFEEVLFRGFLFKSFMSTFLGKNGTIVITAVLFAIIHAQYDWIVMLNVLSVGLLFGYARAKSGSLLPPLIIHFMFNLLATIQPLINI